MLLRAPAALVGKLLIGGQHAIFRFGALACELAAGGLGLALARDMRARGLPLLPRLATIGLCVLAAAIFDAIFFGHPEETLGASLCVGAVLLGGSGRPTLAGLALGGALICKPWGIFALAPALLACRHGILRLCLASLVVALSWMVLAYGVDPLHILRSLSAASNLAVVAHPVDAWWPFDHVVRKAGAETYFAPPPLLQRHGREVPVLLAIPLSLPLALRRLPGARSVPTLRRLLGDGLLEPLGERASLDGALALLALLLLLRCMLDPSNHVYYEIPFIFALLAWDSRTHSAPARALLATILLWLAFHTISGIAGLWVQFAAYMIFMLPFAVMLAGPATGGLLRWPRSSSADHRELLRETREHHRGAVCDDHQVLDPHAELAGQVDARLDRHDAARLERLLARDPRQPGSLVDLQPDPVAEAVAELIAAPGRLDHLAGGGVHLPARGPRGDGREAALLGIEDQP